MKTIRRYRSIINKFLLSLTLCAAAVMVLSSTAGAKLTIKANHDHIKIDFFYHGSEVSVRGDSDPGTDLIIKIASPEGHQLLRKKGRAGGILWMNVGELTYENASNLYFLRSTGPVEEILSPEEARKYNIGYKAMRHHVEIKPVENEEEQAKWFDEFVKYKEKTALYNVSADAIKLTEKDGRQDYYVLMEWPYKATPGTYTATVYAVKDKKVVDIAESSVLVEQVGVVKTLFDMANNRGAVYGIISVLAALGAGFGVGMVFRKGGGAH